MATAAPKKKTKKNKFDTIKNLKEDFLTCGICLDYFANPKSLFCLHKFCEVCLQMYVAKKEVKPGQRFKCPMKCKEYTILPSGGIKQLKTDFILKGLDEFLSVKETERKCDKRSVKDIFAPEETTVKCSIHKEKICELFCEEDKCQVPVCSKCMTTEHNGHKVAEIEILLQNSKKLVDDLINDVENEVVITEKKKELSEQMLHELSQTPQELKDQIDKCLEEIIEKMKQQTEQLKQDIESEVADRITSLDSQTKDIEKRSDILQELKSTLTEAKSMSSIKDLVDVRQKSQSQLQELRLQEGVPLIKSKLRIENNIDILSHDLLELVIKDIPIKIMNENGAVKVEEVEVELEEVDDEVNEYSSSDDSGDWLVDTDEEGEGNGEEH